MMKILLCAATEMEIAPLIGKLPAVCGHDVKVLITGVGLLAATYAITKEALQTKPDLLLQAGIAGSYDKEISLASVVTVKNEIVGDAGVVEGGKFRSLFDMRLLQPDGFPFKNGWLGNDLAIISKFGLPVVTGITVNEISTNAERIRYYEKLAGGGIETMEGAALHYVGLLENISFLQLRAVSNFVGERDKSLWQIEKSVRQLNSEIENILNNVLPV